MTTVLICLAARPVSQSVAARTVLHLRVAAYTNRQPHSGQGWEIGSRVDLVKCDGSLTPIGQIYSEW